MPGTEELMARLSQLEQGYYGDKEAARQKQFMDTYGGRFSNNNSLGMAILNELDARGIDTSAADEAVQEILDTLRTDCQSILDLLGNVQEAAIENAKKVEQIANVVSDAVANNPNAATPDAMPPEVEPAEMPPEMTDAEELNMEGIGGPEGEIPAEQPVEQPVNPVNPEETPAEQPIEQPANPEENPEEAVSDIRTKRIQKMKARWGEKNNTVVSDARTKRIENMRARWSKKNNTVVSDKNLKNVFRPSASMIIAANRGF